MVRIYELRIYSLTFSVRESHLKAHNSNGFVHVNSKFSNVMSFLGFLGFTT